jgi:hypothetical protein
MHHPILFALLVGFVVSRLIFRARMRRFYGHGGCGRRFGGPIDLGAPDLDGPGWSARRGRHFERWSRRWGRWSEELAQKRAAVKVPTVDVAGSLELNQRQREIYDEVLQKAKARLPVAELAEALAILGRDPFDRAALEFLVGKGELADDLEHLHFSLTAEQRAKLSAVASA